MKEIEGRLYDLRKVMKERKVSAFITPSTDPHCGEYIPERWKARRWISGFSGSAGTSVVTLDKAALWTDSRYFIQAREQLSDSSYVLMKDKIEGTPSIAEWLGSVLKPGDTVGVDGWVNTVEAVNQLRDELLQFGLKLDPSVDPYEKIWTDRPGIPDSKLFIQPLEYAGESSKSKLSRIREKIGNHALLATYLEDIAWTLNLRADDILYTPLFVSYLIITPTDATLYINKEKVTDEVEAYLKAEGVSIRPYEAILEDLANCEMPVETQLDKTNYSTYTAIKHHVDKESPIPHMLMFKNATEIKGYRSAHEKDGVAMVKWMKWTLENVPKGGQTEMSLSDKLEAFRREQPLCMGVSFASIMGYGYHGAIVHYEPSAETDIPVKPEGLLLIDSGGQYLDGTTDITRTLPLGPLTWEMRRDYTLVLKGWIKLGSAVFPRGTNGTQLDAFARMDMWKYGINYLHGTGHGVGQFMSVHESIDYHQFRMQWRPTPLLPGMIITDEPGIYIEGSHGVRHEDTMLVVNANFGSEHGKAVEPGCETYDGGTAEGITFGPYYTFEHLTVCPIITSPIIKEMLTAEEVDWFNNYQHTVYERLESRLDNEHREWLKEVTKPI